MWSDPVDHLIESFDAVLSMAVAGGNLSKPDETIYRRMLREAQAHRELEKRTGKVGFEATEAKHG